MFGKHAVQTGRVDATLGRSLNQAEGHRLKADYTGFEIGPQAAEDIVSQAELFVRTVEHEFGLESSVKESGVGRDALLTKNEALS